MLRFIYNVQRKSLLRYVGPLTVKELSNALNVIDGLSKDKLSQLVSILPPNHHFTELIIRNAHLLTLHGGTRLTLVTTRHQFRIVNGRQTVKRILKGCIQCFRQRKNVIGTDRAL